MKNKTLSNIPNLNKEIIYMGLKPRYWVIIVFLSLFTFLAIKVYALILIIPTFIYILKLEKQAKKGNPNFLKSNANFKRIPKSMIDKNAFLKHL